MAFDLHCHARSRDDALGRLAASDVPPKLRGYVADLVLALDLGPDASVIVAVAGDAGRASVEVRSSAPLA